MAMKKFLTACLMIVGMMTMAIAQGPSITLDKEVHDYGTITQGADGGCQFTVTNDGTEPLIIAQCKGSCGCTVPVCEKAPIMPGSTSVISVRYDTKRIGPINKSVTITSNAANDPTKVIRIKGKVEAADLNQSNGGAPVKPTSAGAPVNKE